MNKSDFFNKVVLGYILKDLESIKTLPKRAGEPGGCNFPIALCVLSYMEYLGSFFTLDDFSFKENVSTYIRECFRTPADYHIDILKNIFRNGLAHDYFARGGVSRDGNRPALYRNYDNKVVLDADTLLEDFLASLGKFQEKLSDENFTKRMELAESKISEIETDFASAINTLPSISNMPGARTSGATGYPGPIHTTTLPPKPSENE